MDTVSEAPPPIPPSADATRGSLYWYKDGVWAAIPLAEHLPVEFTPSELALLADALWPLLAERMQRDLDAAVASLSAE